jgi:hypothetical protein
MLWMILLVLGALALLLAWYVTDSLPPDDPWMQEFGSQVMSHHYSEGCGLPYSQAQQEDGEKKREERNGRLSKIRAAHTDRPERWSVGRIAR